MPRALSFALFFSAALAITGLAHYYIWARLVRDLSLSAVWHRTLTGAIIALYVSIPATFLVGRVLGASLGRGLWWVTMVWLGMLLIILVVLAAFDGARALWFLGARVSGEGLPSPERRRLIARLLAGGVALVAGGMGFLALREGRARVAVREVRVRLDRLPSELDGTSIVQWSDVHIGPTLKREFLEQIVQTTNALQPDVIAITGDLVDGSVEELREHLAPLKDLRARYGVFFVTGNHEYYSGAEEWCAELRRLGVRVLRNERVSIGVADASYDLAGVDDFQAEQFGNGHGADLKKALAGRDPTRELVLLAHQPRAVLQAQTHEVGLQLSGHTHGGQIWPWNFMVRLQQPVVAGLARFGKTLIYVSNGTGYWGPPMRLGAPAEITRVLLAAPPDALVKRTTEGTAAPS